MSNFQSLLNMFAAKQPANTPTPAAPQASGAPGAPVAPTSGPAAGTQQLAFQQSGTLPPKEQAPLAEFADIWNTPTQEGEVPPGLDDPYLRIDEAKVQELVNGMNFAQPTAQQQELFAKAIQGDVQAFSEILNGVAREVYYQSAINAARVSERVARTGVERLRDNIPKQVRSISSSETLYKTNPLLNNTALRPIVNAVQAQFQLKHPTASPSELAEMTNKYFQDSAHLFAPTAFADANNGNQQPVGLPKGTTQDFSNW